MKSHQVCSDSFYSVIQISHCCKLNGFVKLIGNGKFYEGREERGTHHPRSLLMCSLGTGACLEIRQEIGWLRIRRTDLCSPRCGEGQKNCFTVSLAINKGCVQIDHWGSELSEQARSYKQIRIMDLMFLCSHCMCVCVRQTCVFTYVYTCNLDARG